MRTGACGSLAGEDLISRPADAIPMPEISRDAPSPKGGPAFLSIAAWPYRAEMAAAALAIGVLLLYGRLLVARDLDLEWTIF